MNNQIDTDPYKGLIDSSTHMKYKYLKSSFNRASKFSGHPIVTVLLIIAFIGGFKALLDNARLAVNVSTSTTYAADDPSALPKLTANLNTFAEAKGKWWVFSGFLEDAQNGLDKLLPLRLQLLGKVLEKNPRLLTDTNLLLSALALSNLSGSQRALAGQVNDSIIGVLQPTGETPYNYSLTTSNDTIIQILIGGSTSTETIPPGTTVRFEDGFLIDNKIIVDDPDKLIQMYGPAVVPGLGNLPVNNNADTNGNIFLAKSVTKEIADAVDCPWYWIWCRPSVDGETLKTLAQTHRNQIAGLIEQGCYADCLIENQLLLDNSDVNSLPGVYQDISEREVNLEGTVAIMDSHDVYGHTEQLAYPYILTTSNGISYQVSYTGITPDGIAPGSKVEVSGVRFGNTLLIPSDTDSFQMTTELAQEVRPMTGSKRMAFITINVTDSGMVNSRISEMRTWYSRSSGGRLSMTITPITASYDVPILSSPNYCNQSTFMSLYQAAGSPAGYDFYFYLIGGSGTFACGILPGSGQETIGGGIPSRQAFSPTSMPLSALIHETGHNMGLERIVDGRSHSSNPDDIMSPSVKYWGATAADLPDFSGEEKVALDWSGTGPIPTPAGPTPSPTPTTTPPPDGCGFIQDIANLITGSSCPSPTPIPLPSPTASFPPVPAGARLDIYGNFGKEVTGQTVRQTLVNPNNGISGGINNLTNAHIKPTSLTWEASGVNTCRINEGSSDGRLLGTGGSGRLNGNAYPGSGITVGPYANTTAIVLTCNGVVGGTGPDGEVSVGVTILGYHTYENWGFQDPDGPNGSGNLTCSPSVISYLTNSLMPSLSGGWVVLPPGFVPEPFSVTTTTSNTTGTINLDVAIISYSGVPFELISSTTGLPAGSNVISFKPLPMGGVHPNAGGNINITARNSSGATIGQCVVSAYGAAVSSNSPGGANINVHPNPFTVAIGGQGTVTVSGGQRPYSFTSVANGQVLRSNTFQNDKISATINGNTVTIHALANQSPGTTGFEVGDSYPVGIGGYRWIQIGVNIVNPTSPTPTPTPTPTQTSGSNPTPTPTPEEPACNWLRRFLGLCGEPLPTGEPAVTPTAGGTSTLQCNSGSGITVCLSRTEASATVSNIGNNSIILKLDGSRLPVSCPAGQSSCSSPINITAGQHSFTGQVWNSADGVINAFGANFTLQ